MIDCVFAFILQKTLSGLYKNNMEYIYLDCGMVPELGETHLSYEGTLDDGNQSTVYNSSAQYKCAPGYQLQQNQSSSVTLTTSAITIQCTADGIWETLPTCSKKGKLKRF